MNKLIVTLNLVLLLCFFLNKITFAQFTEAERLGTIPINNSIEAIFLNMKVGVNKKIFISTGSRIFTFDLKNKRFQNLLNESPDNRRIDHLAVAPNQQIIFKTTAQNSFILNQDGTITKLSCRVAEEDCLEMLLSQFAFSGNGMAFVFTKDTMHGDVILQFADLDKLNNRTLFAGGGSIPIVNIDLNSDAVNRLDIDLNGISNLQFFNDSLYFYSLAAQAIMKINPDGYVRPISRTSGVASDFTVFSNDIVLSANLNMVKEQFPDDSIGIFFHSLQFKEPKLAALIPNPFAFGSPMIPAYDPITDNLYVAFFNSFAIELWRVPDVSRVLQAQVPEWRGYE